MNTGAAEKNPMIVTIALVVTGSLGVGIFLVMPLVVPSLIDSSGFTLKQAGDFSFVQLVTVSVGSLLGMMAGNRFSIRTLSAIALLVLLVTELISPLIVNNYPLFLSVRGVSGIAGGAAVALATGALAQLPGAERNFGLFLFFQISFSMITFLFIPQLVAAFGIAGIFYLLAVVEAIALLFLISYVPGVPVAELRPATADAGAQAGNSSAAWFYSGLTLVGILAFFVAIGSFWTFVGEIGKTAGLGDDTVGRALSLAGLGGIAGSLFSIFVQKRLGAFVPLALAFGLMMLAIYLVSAQSAVAMFTLAALLFLIGWYIFNPYQLGVLASVDRDGRPAMASAALTGLGLGIGPALVSRLGGEGFSAVYTVATVSLGFAIVILTVVIVLSKKLQVQP